MFRAIDIETTTACNRRCQHCPNSVFDRGLPENEKLMSEETFKKIIDELAEIDFDGRISPHSYGEPLMDKRIVKFIAYMRDKLPKAKILIMSNGDFLTVDLLNRLIEAGTDEFLIRQYGGITENMSKVLNYVKNDRLKRKYVKYNPITRETALYNRGGYVKPESLIPKPVCLIGNPLVITYEGNIILCCNDYGGSIVFGNVNEKRIIEIWKSDEFKKIRDDLKNKRYSLPICRRCVGLE